jgi:heat shock protein HslJ
MIQQIHMNKNKLIIIILALVVVVLVVFSIKNGNKNVTPNQNTNQNNTTAEAQSDAEKIASTTWTWKSTNAGGKVVEPKDKTAFTIAFNTADKAVNATTDCNTVFGPYVVDASNKLTFGALGMTKMYCQGSQETEFVDGLSKVKKFYFNGSGALVLEFSSPSDYMLFEK